MWLPLGFLCKFFTIFTFIDFFLLATVESIPRRGNFPWTLILCKFRDHPNEPRPPEWFDNWLNDEVNQGSILRYFGEVSNGVYTIYNSTVLGWYKLPHSKEEIHSLALKDSNLKSLGDPKLQIFYKIKDMCVREAKKRGHFVPREVISVINDEETAVFCREYGVLLTPKFFLSSALAHEMTHSFYIGHSYSDKPVKIFPYSSVGEYDDKYDLMSTANAFMFKSPYGLSGPGLNGPHLDFLGWLPKNRVYYFGTKGHRQEILRLSSLSVPHSKSKELLLILIPYDRDNPQNVFTVEFRTPSLNDRGIEKAAVVVHKIKEVGKNYFSYLVTSKNNSYALEQGMEWRMTVDGNQPIRIKVLAIDGRFEIADVDIFSDFRPTACRNYEVKRRITKFDPVCVTPAEKLSIEENTRQRYQNQDSEGNCLPGLVKRNFMVRNHVCVTPQQRELHRLENVRYYNRKNFFKNLHTWGLNGCKKDFVWRLIDDYDYVCVSEKSQKSSRRQNALDSKRQHETKNMCQPGFIRREAFTGDQVCVSFLEHAQVHSDNQKTKNRYKYYGFFNGVDTVE